ncbi:hypothetical protein B0J13DRAFT_529661 [Dactylonectria estremocensis]|uniref:Uncharacterized protein n=1 Tax=Dactylonectria estremocensis TaxID=1079267 RepID=A0A9P9E6S5_9HYPO|nr:hypothetical protein B0J13DRAFT_529661 [Dactylonectria estremocensis]
MASRVLLYAALALLMVVAIIELSFISTMVGFLHGPASGTFGFLYNGSTYQLHGHPKNLIADQGHTSNGAAGTAFVLVGLGGFLVLWLRSRPNAGKFSNFLYRAWLVINVLSLLLVLTALIYTFVVTSKYSGQSINPAVAAGLKNRKYYLDSWTPQGWFSAVLGLDLVDDDMRSTIANRLRIMRGWQYNLIPFFVIHLAETGIALWDAKQYKEGTRFGPVGQKSDV